MSDVIKDSKELREKCKANIWPKSLLAKYHPRDDYDGDTRSAFTPLIYQSPALEFIIAGVANDATIDNFLESCNYKINTKPTLIVASATLKTGLKNSKSSPAQKGNQSGKWPLIKGK